VTSTVTGSVSSFPQARDRPFGFLYFGKRKTSRKHVSDGSDVHWFLAIFRHIFAACKKSERESSPLVCGDASEMFIIWKRRRMCERIPESTPLCHRYHATPPLLPMTIFGSTGVAHSSAYIRKISTLHLHESHGSKPFQTARLMRDLVHWQSGRTCRLFKD